jgi:hypothetical protein
MKLFSLLLPAAALLPLLFRAAAQAHGGHNHDNHNGHDHRQRHRHNLEGPGRGNCAAPDPTEVDRARAVGNMMETFGKSGDSMSRQELLALVQDVVNGKKEKKNSRGGDIF